MSSAPDVLIEPASSDQFLPVHEDIQEEASNRFYDTHARKKVFYIVLSMVVWTIACIPGNIAAGIISFKHQGVDPHEVKGASDLGISTNETLAQHNDKPRMFLSNSFNQTDEVGLN